MSEHLSILRELFSHEDSWTEGDFVHSFADPKQVVLSWSVFFPKFEIVKGHVVLGPISSEQKEKLAALESLEKPNEFLRSFRWCEVPYQFAERTSTEESHDLYLATLMAESWLMNLKHQFPHQTWETRVLSAEETGSVVGVSFENT